MVPAPQEAGVSAQQLQETETSKYVCGDEVVISGISGIFPSSDNTSEFVENLLNNVDLVVKDDLNFNHPEAPKYYGKIRGVDKFDAQFFKVVASHAEDMEPQSRKLLEQAYMAMYDSGINPLAYKGQKVGVFIGSSYSDKSNDGMFSTNKVQGFILSGCGKSMFSNRISYWIDGKGPSYTLDCACSSSMVCFEVAYNAIRNGEIQAAVVGGCNLCLDPNLGLTLRRTGTVSIDGKTRCFDKNADGSVRAEAINCLFLQKAKDAKRIYAEVVYAHSTYGLQDEEISLLRKKEDLEDYLSDFYSKAKVSPNDVEYIEANGAAIRDVDINELEAIDKVFAKNRTLKVGCVKSNMGNSEPASGLCALTKVCLAYHKGILPANLHYSEPLDVPGVKEGRLQILKINSPFNRGYAAINNFSLNGVNCHVLLKGVFKPKDLKKYECSIPRLVLVSGRQDESITNIFDKLKSQPFDPEIIGMLHNIYQIDTPGHTSRGYVLLDANDKNETVCLAQNATYYSGIKRPLWLVFSGMGSQWPGMAADLMKIPIFAAAMHRCHAALQPLGVNLIKVLTEPDKSIFDNILNCFIGISAVQIGLIDVLKAIGIEADYIVGHSQGEMGCAYYDDTFTTEETILAAYSRGIVSLESTFTKGAMVAVGLGYKDIKSLCPPEIDVACHNSNTSVTLSGPADRLKQFVTELTEKGIFAREVPSTGIAFHSRYIKHAGPDFLDRLKKIISSPKPRSSKWISTSIPEENWDTDLAKYSSAEYHTNNLMSSVLFEEATQHIPDDAIVVEVAPHGLLQAILKRSHPDCVHIPLTHRGEKEQLPFFFKALGKIYQEGINMKMDALYPQIEFPVSTETRMISQYVDWEHSESWKVITANQKKLLTSLSREIIVSVHDEEFQFISGYVRDGHKIFPESAILYYVWETLAMYKGVNINELSVTFHDIHFHGEVILKEILKLQYTINKGNDYFEVTNKGALIANGYVAEVLKPKFDVFNENVNDLNDDNTYTTNDIYTHLHSNGMTLRGEFQSICQTNFKQADVKWTKNWITFLDSLIQLNILARRLDGIVIPKLIKKITISVEENNKEIPVTIGGQTCFIAKFNNVCEITRCAGVEIRHLIMENRQIKKQIPDVLQSFSFVPYYNELEMSVEEALLVNLQIVADNITDKAINITEINNSTKNFTEIIKKVSRNVPDIKIVFNTGKPEEIKDSNLIIIQDIQGITLNLRSLIDEIRENTFILVVDNQTQKLKNGCFNIISTMKVHGKELVLLKTKEKDRDVICINIRSDNDFTWVSTVQGELQGTRRVVLVSEKQPHCGLFGLVKRLLQKYPNKISAVIVDDYSTPAFNRNEPLFKEQLQKGIVFNVLYKNKWGSYFYTLNKFATNVKDFKLTSVKPGLIDGLKWSETVSESLNDNIVQVCFAGPSIRDIQKTVGIVDSHKNDFGYDFSGFDKYGKRVMGLVTGGAIASTVKADPDLLWPVPEHWSLEEAATVPLPYAHAYYLLVMKCQLQEGQTVFVSGGAGALGQAVISICLALKCKVFTSVSDMKKKQFLLKLFPQLKEYNIGCSLNGDFKDIVLVHTNNKRCDFVISCASGAEREAAMKCVAPCGVFLDVNVNDSKENQGLGMSFGEQEKNYVTIRLQTIFNSENIEEKKKLQWLIAQGIANGIIRPLTRVTYPTTEVSKAFRLLSLNKNRGRVLLKIKDAEIQTKSLNAILRANYSRKCTYVIVCDKTGLGIELANKLIRQGARKLILHMKSKNVPGVLHLKLAAWQKHEASVKISTENLYSHKNCVQLLNDAEKLGPVQGIFVVEENTEYKNSNQQDFIEKYKTSAAVIANLDVISRNNCPQLSIFAVISKSAQSEANAYTNSIIDKICQARRTVGLPAISFKIEHLEELQQNNHKDTKIQAQNIPTVLNALEISIKQQQSNVLTYDLNNETGTEFLDQIRKILGIRDMNDVDENLLVGDLIISEINVLELKNAIKDTFKIEYSNSNLRKQSIKSLKLLNQADIQRKNTVKNGLGTFYTFVDEDECTATNIVISHKTMINKNIKKNELDGTAPHLFLIPGFEGHHQIFNSICQRLKISAATLQLGPDVPNDSIHDMALNCFKHIKKTFEIKTKFYLFGYSFGVNVALEVAALLEKDGYKGVVFCLDSGPDSLLLQLDACLGTQSDNELQDMIIDHMFKLMTGQSTNKVMDEIKKANTWSDKIELCINNVKCFASYSTQYQRQIIESVYKKIILAKNYKPMLKLDSQIILIKCVPNSKLSTLEPDYGLSKYSNKLVKIIEINSDHESAPRDIKIPSIINSYLDPEVLEEFKSYNLCDKYSLD